MKARTSKIARLPKTIRDELNHKIENGLLGKTITNWLNNLPEVKQIMAEQFGGRVITHQNLSEWRHTGFIDWQMNREGRQHWWEMIEAARELSQTGNPTGEKDASGYLGSVLLVELAQALNQLHRTKNPRERWKLLRLLSGSLSRLRNDDTREKRFRLKQLQHLARTAKSRAVQPVRA